MTETYRSAWEGSRASISYGLPFTDATKKHVEEIFDARKVYILASRSLATTTTQVQKLQDVLGDQLAGIWIGMKPHTLWSECLKITEDARSAEADLIITIGGGSLTDAAKIIALALANDVNDFTGLHDLTTSGRDSSSIKEPTVPIVSIPTTLSGGEYNDRAGGTDDETNQKHSFSGPIYGPRLVILDPELTISTPSKWWLSTGVRAVDHCIEALCSLQATEQSDVDATAGLQKLVPGLLRCKKDDRDLLARLDCQLAVISAVKATKNAPMGASHGIGHQLGPLGVGHGETSCVLLPAVCAYNKPVNEQQQRKVRDIISRSTANMQQLNMIPTRTQGDLDLADLLDRYFGELGMPRSLFAVGVDEEQFAELAKTSLTDRHLATNPIKIESEWQVMEILRMAYGAGSDLK